MTGGGRGLCVLKLPAGAGEAVAGLAGRAGRPVGGPMGARAELARLRRQARHMETVLAAIRQQMDRLEAMRP